MILDRDRKIATVLIRAGVWKIVQPRDDTFRCARVRPRHARGLWERMRARQTKDGLHHAPCCPGNEWGGAELVFQRCTCGAASLTKDTAP